MRYEKKKLNKYVMSDASASAPFVIDHAHTAVILAVGYGQTRILDQIGGASEDREYKRQKCCL